MFWYIGWNEPIAAYKNIYTNLQELGFTLIFKEVTYDGNGKVKGNCDADLVLQSVRDYYEKKYDKTTKKELENVKKLVTVLIEIVKTSKLDVKALKESYQMFGHSSPMTFGLSTRHTRKKHRNRVI